MKRILLIMIMSLSVVCGFGQKNGDLNPLIYDSQGQYIKECPTAGEIGFVKTELYVINKGLYPRLILDGSSYYDSNFGIYGHAEIGRMNRDGYLDNGYYTEETSYVNVAAALSYYFKRDLGIEKKIFLGAGYCTGKSYLGPIAGVTYYDKKWDASLIGQISVNSDFRTFDKATAKPGFDPNSWYRAKLLRRLSKETSLGLISERFYLHGIMAEHEFGRYWKKEGFKLMICAGQSFPSGNFAFGIGATFKTLEK